MNVEHLPSLNAALNLLAAAFLLQGRRAIKRDDRRRHRHFMIAALVASAFFLCSYLAYHTLAPGMTRYQGVGWLRGLYFFILATHIPLAALMAPVILVAVALAWKQRFTAHARVTRWLWPVWMYVSVTGVLIYLMLYVF